MGLMRRLADLDNRVLGKPKPARYTAADYRRVCLMSAGLLLPLVLVAGLTHHWESLAPGGGFFGFTIVNGARWYSARRRTS